MPAVSPAPITRHGHVCPWGRPGVRCEEPRQTWVLVSPAAPAGCDFAGTSHFPEPPDPSPKMLLRLSGWPDTHRPRPDCVLTPRSYCSGLSGLDGPWPPPHPKHTHRSVTLSPLRKYSGLLPGMWCSPEPTPCPVSSPTCNGSWGLVLLGGSESSPENFLCITVLGVCTPSLPLSLCFSLSVK